MFKKIILITFLILPLKVFATPQESQEPERPVIIPRSSWWANELYTSLESSYWKSILEKQKKYQEKKIHDNEKQEKEKHRKILQYINENFAKQNKITKKVSYDPNSWFKLAWPLKYTDYVNAIIIHHTSDEYENSLEWIKDIYRYHSLNRAWGDIGYNYIIGYNGEIFEGRKWGDYISAAHSRWNNNSTVGISVMGNYENKPINQEQYKSLETLVRYLAWKYGIDFSKKYYYNMDCAGEKCKIFPLETRLDSTLVGHKDTGHTSWPGKSLYAQIQKLRKDNISFTSGFTPIKREEDFIEASKEKPLSKTPKIQRLITALKPYSNSKLWEINKQIDGLLLDKSISHERRKNLQILRLAVKLSLKD